MGAGGELGVGTIRLQARQPPSASHSPVSRGQFGILPAVHLWPFCRAIFLLKDAALPLSTRPTHRRRQILCQKQRDYRFLCEPRVAPSLGASCCMGAC